jgi:TRAP-type transport system periplasmic protein
MKRFLIPGIILAATLSLIFGGCAAQPGAPTSTPQTSAPITSGAPNFTSAPAKTTVPATSTVPASTSALAQVFEMRFSHHNPPQAFSTVTYLNPWAKKVEAATNGAVKITMFPAQSIAASQDNYDATINNLAQMTWIPISAYPGRFPLSEVICLPFLTLPSGTIDGKKAGPSLVNSRIIQELYETVPEIQKEWAQTRVMFLHSSDSSFILSKKPVKNISDMKGLKIAVLGTGPAQDMWKRIGASPLFLPIASIYENAQKGVIDAATLNSPAIPTYRFNEVFSYMTDMVTFPPLFAMVMNLETWNKLPPEVQKQVLSVAGQEGSQFASTSGFADSIRADLIKGTGYTGAKMEVFNLDPGEQEKMKEIAGKPIWDDWAKQMKAKGLAGDKALEATLKLIDKYK